MGLTEGWRDDVIVLPIKGGSHCSDLQTPEAGDTEDMRRQRAGVEAQVQAWISMLQAKNQEELRPFGGATWPRPGPEFNAPVRPFGAGQARATEEKV